MRGIFAALLFILTITPTYAQYQAGVMINSSTNMLMWPDGESGTYALLNGSYNHSLNKKINISYSFEGAFLQHYGGLQYHNHSLSPQYSFTHSDRLTWIMSLKSVLARFGDVTLINGYNTYGVQSNVKSYLLPTMLMRWEVSVNRKDYMKYKTENYDEAEMYLRLDKFFTTKTTLRFQLDSGIRRYINMGDKPYSSVMGGRAKIAQSITDNNGVSIEAYTSSLSTEFSTADSSQIYDRVFLDDKYKYSCSGISFSIKHIIPEKGSIHLESGFTRRNYEKGVLTDFNYLPSNGWKEEERDIAITCTYTFDFMPGFINPSYKLYYIDVKASESFLSYKSLGLSVTLSIY
jgi:hypothetical protein